MPLLEGSFIKKKAGPLPVWAWMGLALGVALAFSSWRRNKADSKKQAPAGTTVDTDQYPDSVKTPQYTFVDADTTLITNKFEPPGGGRPPDPPRLPPIKRPPPRPRPDPVPAPSQNPSPTPLPSPTPIPPPAPAGAWGTIVKWAKGQAAGTPSTLWGLAESVYGNGKGALWTQIWNAPQNAALRTKRGAPEKIQPGDRFWVPK